MNLHDIMLAVQLAGKNGGNPAEIGDLLKSDALVMQTLGYTAVNLLPNRCSSRTAYGVTATVNADGSITLNGTSSRAFVLYASVSDGINNVSDMPLKKAVPNGSYHLSGGVTGKARMQLYSFDNENNGTIQLAGNVTVDDTYPYNCVRIAIENGMSFNDETLRPMLCDIRLAGSSYEPYKPSIEERLAALEDITVISTSLVNTLKYPFNNSEKTIALSGANVRYNKDYTVTVEVESYSGGWIGDIVVSDKLLNGFKVAHTGSAKTVNVKIYVQGGK